MNDDTYTPCTNCGRPMKYCKGQCCGKPQGCDCKEYGPAVCGVIRQRQPECPYTAVIPSMVVEHADNLKDLCDTFVHVSDLNTTFYIDDKHRTIITWAGPVEYDNYDLAANSLGLRSQFLLDFANNRGAYYDKTGNYKIFNFGESGSSVMTLDLTYDDESTSWQLGNYGAILRTEQDGTVMRVCSFEVPNPSFTDHGTGDEYSLEDVFEMLEDGAEIRFNGIPVSYHQVTNTGSTNEIVLCDNVNLSTKNTYLNGYGNCYSYSGIVFPQTGPSYNPLLGIALSKELNSNGSLNRYVLTTQGIYTRIEETN